MVITTNIDRIYDTFVTGQTDGHTRIKTFSSNDAYKFIRSPNNHLVKVHGCVSNPDNLIFTQNEYARARSLHHDFYSAITAAFLSQTVLFIGTGLNDPDMRLLLENIRLGFPNMPPHYFVSSARFHQDELIALRESRNLKILKYPKDDHSVLVKSLAKLVSSIG